MSKSTQLRIVGYTAFISMYVANMFYMDWYRKNSNTRDERLLVFKGLGNRFFTTWTFMLQIAYAVFGLLCDLLILKNSRKKTYTLPLRLGELRDLVFSALVLPSSLVVSTIFWGLYNYDRSLIFPEYLDVVLPTISNHVIHTAIVPVVLFEVVMRSRIVPSTHLKNIQLMTVYVCLYLSVLLFTYNERGVWLYPIFGQLYGTVNFLFALAGSYLLFITFYLLQWPLTAIIHDSEVKKTRKIPKRKKRV